MHKDEIHHSRLMDGHKICKPDGHITPETDALSGLRCETSKVKVVLSRTCLQWMDQLIVQECKICNV